MKKLSIISNQITNNTYSYTGKGSFEVIVNKHKELILGWLEDLIPLQNQIELLLKLEDIEFQKRNYTRILTKLFPEQYREFVSLNILVRDANILAQYYNEEYNITILYDNLIKDKYLKYPGKYDKYVEFLIFQKFVMMYRDELITSLNNDNQTVISNKKEQREEELIEDSISNENIEEIPAEEVKELELEKELKLAKESKDNDINWTQLLLGKLR